MFRSAAKPALASVALSLLIACGQGRPTEPRVPARFATTKASAMIVDPGDGSGGSPSTVTTQMLHPVTGAPVLELAVDTSGAATWTHSETGLSRTMHLGVDPTAGDIESAAQLIFGQVQKAADGANFDAFGCDVPRPFAPLTCSDQGACCDQHDLCYAQNHCTSKSWMGAAGTPCDQCNMAAVRCIMFRNPGPSECCDLRNAWGGELCGTPRCPGMWGFADYPTCGGRGPTGTGDTSGGTTGTGSSGTGSAGGSSGSSCDAAGLWSDDECADDDECDGETSVVLKDGTECFE